MYLCRCSLFLGISVVNVNNNREKKRYMIYNKFPRFFIFNSLLGEQMVFNIGYGDNNE